MDGVRPVTSNPNPEEPNRKKAPSKAVEVIRTVIEAAAGSKEPPAPKEAAREPAKEPAKETPEPSEPVVAKKPDPEATVDEKLSQLREDTRRVLAEKKAPEKPAEAKLKQEASVNPRPSESRPPSNPAPPPRPPVNSPAMTVLSQASSPVRRPEEPARGPVASSGGGAAGSTSEGAPVAGGAAVVSSGGRSVREGSPVDPSRPSSQPAPGNTAEEKLVSMEHARQAEQHRSAGLQADEAQLVDQGNRARMGVTSSGMERTASERDARQAGEGVARGRVEEAGLARRVGSLRGDLVQTHSKVEESQGRTSAAQTALGHAATASGEAASAVVRAESELARAPSDESEKRAVEAHEELASALSAEEQAEGSLQLEQDELVRRSDAEGAVAGELQPLSETQDRAVDLVNMAQDQQAESLSRLGTAGAERGSMEALGAHAQAQRPVVQGDVARSRLTLESLNQAIDRLRDHNQKGSEP